MPESIQKRTYIVHISYVYIRRPDIEVMPQISASIRRQPRASLLFRSDLYIKTSKGACEENVFHVNTLTKCSIYFQ